MTEPVTIDRRGANALRLARINIVVALVVLGLKMIAQSLTGSVALYSDALESGVNLATAAAALIAMKMADRPADRTHQFGHHKAEYIAAVIEGALILLAAVLILQSAYSAYTAARMPVLRGDALICAVLATVINFVWALIVIRKGRELASPALVADGWHLMSDVASSVGVVIGLVLAIQFGFAWLDPLIAGLAAIFVLVTGLKLLSQSFSGLMDEGVNAQVQLEIRRIIAEQATGAIQAHDIRTRVAGRATFVVFHLVVPGAMTVKAAHAICDRLEAALEDAITGATVTIHIEPEAERKAEGDIVHV